MKKLKHIIAPLLIIAFGAASLLLCCYKPAAAAMSVQVPACHKHQKPQTPSQDHQCCKKSVMMQVAIVNQDVAKDNLNKLIFDLLALTLNLTPTLSKTFASYQFPISPQKYAAIPLYLKTHSFRI